MKTEQRQWERLACSGEAAVTLNPDISPVPGAIHDLSVEGCRIELREARSAKNAQTWADAAKQATVVELTFHVNRLPFRVRGEIRRVEPNYMVGFRFTQVSTRIKRQLTELIDELAVESKKRMASVKP